jgi:hypothetical protein
VSVTSPSGVSPNHVVPNRLGCDLRRDLPTMHRMGNNRSGTINALPRVKME